MSTVIKVLGTSCSKCLLLEKNVRAVVAEMDMDAEVIKVDNIEEIINYGVLMTPGLVINEEIKSTGRVPSDKDLKELFTQYI
ncbi:MAG: TM0996/MTH895 family glutaredoxin-like protein [Chlorobi bacterium]|nr:TM0996/MTH895 family glutaredoxin-like protein [Chlorobiota bacterium]